ncbi:hypothetical protein MESS2_1030153 [Mesorhizobium metallidurans STM 2683]|uniref:Uncharacterized protein n=1 Tax=Mesorhizobium metallidurans STM 2683 TaxID=1297569 RepID=M5EUC5_9HYPH|nr:hypothetical protein MESS2_1030153 [Mesorhizobium metallidurans STM 2683]
MSQSSLRGTPFTRGSGQGLLSEQTGPASTSGET